LIYFQGSDAIECILLDTSKVKEVVVHAQSFEKMDNLRMLVLHTPKYISDVSRKELDDLWTFLLYSTEYISNVSLESSLVGLPDTLKFLYWRDFPQRFWPPNFCPQNLVILEMPGCRLEQLWEGDQVFQVIYVPFSFKLSKIKINYTSICNFFVFSPHFSIN